MQMLPNRPTCSFFSSWFSPRRDVVWCISEDARAPKGRDLHICSSGEKEIQGKKAYCPIRLMNEKHTLTLSAFERTALFWGVFLAALVPERNERNAIDEDRPAGPPDIRPRAGELTVQEAPTSNVRHNISEALSPIPDSRPENNRPRISAESSKKSNGLTPNTPDLLPP